jgi:hypothetical protein
VTLPRCSCRSLFADLHFNAALLPGHETSRTRGVGYLKLAREPSKRPVKSIETRNDSHVPIAPRAPTATQSRKLWPAPPRSPRPEPPPPPDRP